MIRFFPARSHSRLLSRTCASILLVGLAACADRPSPTSPAANCPNGVKTNSGKCVAATSALTTGPGVRTSSVPVASAVAAATTFTTFENPDASWTGSTTLIDISSIPNSSPVTAVTDGNLTVALSPTMTKAHANVDPDEGWDTWSDPPYSEVSSPHVLALYSGGSAELTLSKGVFAFGFEIEPNPFLFRDLTVTFILSSGPTTVGTITRTIHGEAGARLMAARSTTAFDKITISSSEPDGFAIGQLRYSENTSEATEFVPANEPATVTVTEDGKDVAGIDIPANTFGENVTVTVRFETLDAGAHCHDFLMGQIGRCLEITARDASGEKVPNQQPLTVGLCLESAEPLEIFKFEEPQGRATPLQQTSAAFLDCNGFQYGSARPKTGIQGFALGLMKRVGDWIGPKPLMAAHLGFGGIIGIGGGTSFFTWASPIQVASAKLVVNMQNSGKDQFGVDGTFDLSQKNFDPYLGEQGFSPSAVTVAFGEFEQTIAPSSFIYSKTIKRWVYTAPKGTKSGVQALQIDPISGAFTVGGASAPSEGERRSFFRAFSLQIGHRIRGAGLLCGTDKYFKCQLLH